MAQIRLNKFIAHSGVVSRRKADELISTGRVQVNHSVVENLATIIDTETDVVFVDGEIVKIKKAVYFLLNKPKGYVTTTSDEQNRNTVVSLIKTKEKIFPVGRLDINTTGVLILTNDGDFANSILHPSHNIPRTYKVKLHRQLTEEDAIKLYRGMNLEGRRSRFEEVTIISKVKNIVQVVTAEGRNHFVKNMFKAAGYFVEALERTAFGPFNIKNLPVGAYRVITSEEIDRFYRKYSNVF